MGDGWDCYCWLAYCRGRFVFAGVCQRGQRQPFFVMKPNEENRERQIV